MKIGIIGLGLIGGSFGRTLLKKTDHTVYGMDIDEKAMDTAMLIKAINSRLTYDNLKEMDIVFIALYPRLICHYLEKISPFLKPGCIVMDGGGNKRLVCDKMRELKKVYPDLEFMGCHPMAGREFSGISHASFSLFDRASNIIVPIDCTIQSIEKIKKLSQDMGFQRVVITSDENHDSTIAFTSQLAHIVSNAYVRCEKANEHFGFSAGSFKDMTRVAKMNSKMWAELMCDNADNLVENLNEFILNLQAVADRLKEKDESGLCEILEKGNQLKLYVDKIKGEKE